MKPSLLNDTYDYSQNKLPDNKTTMSKNEIFYAIADKPLDFTHKDLKSFEDLTKAEPRSGRRKPLESNDSDKPGAHEQFLERATNTNLQSEEELAEKRKKFAEMNEVVEGRINAGKDNDNKRRVNKVQEEPKVEGPKKKVKYIKYTNSLIIHSNRINSFQGVKTVLENVLPDVETKLVNNRNKLDLLQWIDISHNRVEEIHEDIIDLPFLKILYCHANYIKEIESVLNLRRCKSLINLTLHGNPIEQIKGYRNYIIEIVSNLEKLDFTLVSDKELDIVFHKGSRYGEKRNKKGKVIEYPKLDEDILKRMKMPDDHNDGADDS